MESYHTSDPLPSGGYPDMHVRDSRARRTLRPYESISTPPITLLLSAIVARCAVGGCITPGVRALAESAGISPGLVSPALYTLARDGWIRYDGRVIMLLINPDHDADQTDHDEDHFLGDHDADRAFDRSGAIDLDRDRFESDMVLTTTRIIESESVVVVESGGGMQGGDLPADRPPPAAQLMAELGANPTIIRDAYEARADWTSKQVRDRWEYDQRRMSASDGRLMAGIFFTALRSGELAPDNRPIDPQSYAGRDDIMLGSDLPPPDTIRDRALALAGQPTAETIGSYSRDVVFLQCRLGMGDSDAAALQALEKHRKRVRQ